MVIQRVPNVGLRVRSHLKAGEGPNGGAAALTPEQLAAIRDEVNPLINGAIASMSKRLEKQIGDKVTDGFKAFEGKLAELGKARETDPNEPAVDPKNGKGRKEDVEMAALRRQVELATTTSNELKAQYEAEKTKNRATEFAQKTTAALESIAGIKDPFMAKLALGYLRDEGKLVHEEDGTVLFNDANGSIPIEMGLKSWAKSDEAKRFMPPTGVQGSNSRPGALSPGAGPLTDDQRRSALNDLLSNALT